MRDKDHRPPFLAPDLQQQLLRLNPRHRVQSAKGLVHQQHRKHFPQTAAPPPPAAASRWRVGSDRSPRILPARSAPATPASNCSPPPPICLGFLADSSRFQPPSSTETTHSAAPSSCGLPWAHPLPRPCAAPIPAWAAEIPPESAVACSFRSPTDQESPQIPDPPPSASASPEPVAAAYGCHRRKTDYARPA